MKRSDIDIAKDIEALALTYLEAREERNNILWAGGSIDGKSILGGKGRKPETLGHRVDRMRRTYITREMLNAYRVVSSLDDVEYMCAIGWLMIKNRTKPKTENRYRLCDLLLCLSVYFKTSFTREMWVEIRKNARQKMVEKAQYVWPDKESDTRYAKTA